MEITSLLSYPDLFLFSSNTNFTLIKQNKNKQGFRPHRSLYELEEHTQELFSCVRNGL